MALKLHEYADAWPWTVRTIGARTMFMSAIVAAVYVVFVLFGNFAEVTATHGIADAVARLVGPMLVADAAVFALGLVLYLIGRRRDAMRGR